MPDLSWPWAVVIPDPNMPWPFVIGFAVLAVPVLLVAWRKQLAPWVFEKNTAWSNRMPMIMDDAASSRTCHCRRCGKEAAMREEAELLPPVGWTREQLFAGVNGELTHVTYVCRGCGIAEN